MMKQGLPSTPWAPTAVAALKQSNDVLGRGRATVLHVTSIGTTAPIPAIRTLAGIVALRVSLWLLKPMLAQKAAGDRPAAGKSPARPDDVLAIIGRDFSFHARFDGMRPRCLSRGKSGGHTE